MKLKCIIFDVDGTMADTERDGHRVAFNRAFAEKGLDWHWHEKLYGQLLKVTGGKERIKYYQSDFIKKIILNDTQIKQLHACKTKHYVELLESGKIPLRHGVKQLIEQANALGIRLAIATTTTPINVSTLLKSTLGQNSENYFDVIAAGDIVANKKPAADIYNYTLAYLGLHASECVAIEDSHAGLISATDAGIKTVVTSNNYTQNQDFSKAVLVKPDFAEINPKLLIQIIEGEVYV